MRFATAPIINNVYQLLFLGEGGMGRMSIHLMEHSGVVVIECAASS